MALIDTIRASLGTAWHVGSEAFYSALLPATDGTVEASKPITADSNKDVTGLRHLTTTGTLTVGANTTTSIQLLIRNPNDISPGAGNDYENECHIRLWAGTTTDHRSYINFADHTGADKWLIGRNASDTWILYNSTAGHRFRCYNGEAGDYSTYLSSSSIYPVRINYSESGVNHGSGGFEVWSGGAYPSVLMFDIASYTADTNMISVYNNGAGYAPASILLDAKQSSTRGQGIFCRNTPAQTSWFAGVPYNTSGLKYIIGYASQVSFDPSFAQTANALFTITSTGNVGIGVTSPTSFISIKAGTTSAAQINLASSTAPTAPNDGDVWFDGSALKIRIGGVTKSVTVS